MGTDHGTEWPRWAVDKIIREENIKGDGSSICVNIEMTKN